MNDEVVVGGVVICGWIVGEVVVGYLVVVAGGKLWLGQLGKLLLGS